MSDRRLRRDVEVRRFLDPDLEVVLKARERLSDPDKWMQGHFAKGQRKCLAGHLLKAGASAGDELNRIARKLGFNGCEEMVQFNDSHSHPEVLTRVDQGIGHWMLWSEAIRPTQISRPSIGLVPPMCYLFPDSTDERLAKSP